MASIQTLGLGSNVLTSELVEQIIAADREGTEKLINSRTELTEAKISAFGEINSKMSAFQDIVADLTDDDVISGTVSSSSDETILTATAGSSAVPGTYTVEVQEIAQAHSLATESYADSTSIVSTSGGVLEFTFGTTTYTDPGGAYDTFTENADKTGATVTIAANASLSDVRDAINNASLEATASIVFDGAGYRLSIVSDDSGVDNSMEIVARATANGALSTDGLEALGYNADQVTAANMTESQGGQDAVLTFNGLSVTRESNEITDLITGTTLNLQSDNTGQNVTVTIGADLESFTEKIDELVAAYNDLAESVDFYTAYDAEKEEAGILTGDISIRSAMLGVNNILASAVNGISGKEFESFAELGIERDQNNEFRLKFSVSKFLAAMSDDRDTVINIFGVSGATTDSLIEYSNDSINTKAGEYDINITTLASKGAFEGAIVSTLDFATAVEIDDANDEYTINVDGNTGSFTLAQGSYTTGDSLAAELQSKINGTSDLSSNGAKVSVTYDSANYRFDIISNKYGSSSQVSFTSVDTNSANSLGINELGIGTFDGSDLSALSSSYLVGLGASTVPADASVATTDGINFNLTNATFSLDVDGGGAVAVTVNEDASSSDLNGDSVFGDRNDILQAVQNAIDATALSGDVTASFDNNNKLVFTTSAVGSAKSIEITAIGVTATDTLLGLNDDDGAQTNGRDAGLTLAASDATFDFTLDGIATATTIEVAAGTYTTGNDIATAVETAINTALGVDANFTGLVVGASSDVGTRDISTVIDFNASNAGFVLNVNGTSQEVIINTTPADNIVDIQTALDASFGGGVVTASLSGTGLVLTTDTTGHTEYLQVSSDGRGSQTTAGAVIAAGIDFSGANNATFDMTVDGVTMSVDVNTDASSGDEDDTLSAIQTAIDTALEASGQFQAGDVVAKLDGTSQLILETASKLGVKTANTFGSSASIQISNIAGTTTANMGLVAETKTDGYDAFGVSDDVKFGYDVTANVDYINDSDNGTGHLEITIGGNATTLEFTAASSIASSALGIHLPDGSETTVTTGTDVEGTINGVVANGSGQYLAAQSGNTDATNGYYVANQSAIISAAVVVDSTNDTFTMNLNGVEAEVTISQGTYATGDALAAALESGVNATSAFSSASYSVKAEYTSDAASSLFGKIGLISNITGSTSQVTMTTVSAAAITAYGFESGQADGEVGSNAVGEVDGASGVRIKVLGGATGDRGTINYISGLADQLNTLLETYLKTNTGTLNLKVDGLNDDLAGFAEQQAELDIRMAAQETLLRAKFLAADSIIATIKTTESFLTQQFEAYAAAGK
ncbi:MAG: flagellar filament capping protein FliD [Bermanella sp.]